MNRCTCGSYAINPDNHGRQGDHLDLCDVCYWRARHDALAADLAATLDKLAKVEEIAFALGAMEDPPCFVCGYNGPDYFQPGTHPCAQRHHEARRIERLRRQREGE